MKTWNCFYPHEVYPEFPNGVGQLVAANDEQSAKVCAHHDLKSTRVFYRGEPKDWLVQFICEVDMIARERASVGIMAYFTEDDFDAWWKVEDQMMKGRYSEAT